MLILTRRTSESVDLTDKRTNERLATVTILGKADNSTVRIGFDCPAHIKIERDDIKDKRSDAYEERDDSREG